MLSQLGGLVYLVADDLHKEMEAEMIRQKTYILDKNIIETAEKKVMENPAFHGEEVLMDGLLICAKFALMQTWRHKEQLKKILQKEETYASLTDQYKKEILCFMGEYVYLDTSKILGKKSSQIHQAAVTREISKIKTRSVS